MKPKPPVDQLAFGKIFTGVTFLPPTKCFILTSPNVFLLISISTLADHMLTIDWTAERGWEAPKIEPFANFSVHPGAKVPVSVNVPKSILSSTRCYTMPKNCLRAWRPTEVWMGRSGCSDRCTTWPGWTWRPQEPASPPLTGTSWWSASGSWWWSTRSGCPTTPPPPSTSGPPWSGRSPPLEWPLLEKQDSSSSSVLWDPTTPLDSSQWTFWQILSMFEPGLAVVGTLRWGPTMLPPSGHRFHLLQNIWQNMPALSCNVTPYLYLLDVRYYLTLSLQKIAEQHGCHQCLWLFGADHEITEVANIPILIYSYILIYPNPDPDSCIPTLIPILIIPNPDPDSYIPSIILILIS